MKFRTGTVEEAAEVRCSIDSTQSIEIAISWNDEVLSFITGLDDGISSTHSAQMMFLCKAKANPARKQNSRKSPAVGTNQ